MVEGFAVTEVAAGLVLRHPQREPVQLVGVAAAVWLHADGLRSVDDLAVLVGAPVDAVWRALDELADAELMVARVAPPAASRGLSRREVLSLAAAGAVTAGLAPLGAAAAGEQKGQVQAEQLFKASEQARADEQKVKEGGGPAGAGGAAGQGAAARARGAGA